MGAAQIAFDFFGRHRPVRARARSAEPVAGPAGATGLCVLQRVEDALSRRLGPEVQVTFTDNARTMLSCRHRGGVAHVRLHHMFADAEPGVLDSVGRYLDTGDARAAGRLSTFIRDNRTRIRHAPRRRMHVRARGSVHDLAEIFERLEARYFDGALGGASIGWGRYGRPSGRRRRSIKLGSYRARDSLIRVHPVLDQAWVPTLYVEYVVYHEMLHHVLGIESEGGRRRMHTREFRARERDFDGFAEATAWERRHLDRLLSG